MIRLTRDGVITALLVVAALFVGSLVAAYSFQIAIGLLAAIYVIDMIATIFLVPELKGTELK